MINANVAIPHKDRIIDIAKDYDLEKVYVFGSYARREASAQSDLYILVDTQNSKATILFSLGALYEDLRNALNMDIDLMTLNSLLENATDEYFQHNQNIFVDNIKKDLETIMIHSVKMMPIVMLSVCVLCKSAS